jgi:pimeloyl-ACP methyl ester carboxylesterase/DNA-binding CsgD family transcriptional regulator
MDPTIKYARTRDGANIAYQTIGDGFPLVYVPPGGSLDQAGQLPPIRSWMEGLAAGRRVVRLDYRGLGLSDRDWKFSPRLTALDVEAVVEREGLRRFAILGMLQTCATAIWFACEHPEAVSHLILWSPYAHLRDYVATSAPLRAALAAGEKDWQTLSELIGLQAAGWADAAQARSFAAYLRAGASPDHYVDIEDFDLTPQLGGLSMPVLVLHRREVPFPTLEVARHVALNIPSARFVLFEGAALLPFFGDTGSVLAAIDDFLAQAAEPIHPAGLTEREFEILALLAGGRSNAAIAGALTISTRTVERHIGNIYIKIGVHSRSEATAYAFRNGIATA